MRVRVCLESRHLAIENKIPPTNDLPLTTYFSLPTIHYLLLPLATTTYYHLLLTTDY